MIVTVVSEAGIVSLWISAAKILISAALNFKFSAKTIRWKSVQNGGAEMETETVRSTRADVLNICGLLYVRLREGIVQKFQLAASLFSSFKKRWD